MIASFAGKTPFPPPALETESRVRECGIYLPRVGTHSIEGQAERFFDILYLESQCSY
jgi:hypothetical protein